MSHIKTNAGHFTVESFAGRDWSFEIRNEITGNAMHFIGEHDLKDLLHALNSHHAIYMEKSTASRRIEV